MPSYVSLFCGCGGLDLGFLNTGYDCLRAYDISETCVATYNHNLRPTATIADLDADDPAMLNGRPDVVIAGPPCQGFSTIGLRDPDDSRNALLLKPVQMALAARARVLLLENVRGVLSGAHRAYWQEALLRLHRGGYTTATLTVAAAAAGLPQLRRRVVLVAARGGFNPPTARDPERPVPLRLVLDVPAASANHDPRRLDPTSRTGLIAARIGRGQKLSNVRSGPRAVHTWDIPSVFGCVSGPERELLETVLLLRRRSRRRSSGDADPVPYSTLKEHFRTATSSLVRNLVAKGYLRRVGTTDYDLRYTFNGKFRRLDPDRPAHSVLTKFCDPTHFLHPFENRAFTVREAARLQGFPDAFRFLGSPRQQAIQVGNAVPPPVATRLARWVLTELL